MRITLDKATDAAYIRLGAHGQVDETWVCDTDLSASGINLDFDKQGRLVGVEVIPASRGLTEELLKEAEIIG